jgi:predicted acylesterase/phospholipase RssA
MAQPFEESQPNESAQLGRSGLESRFDAVVFAGGGCRCFWQAGFWSVVSPELEVQPRVVVGVSAGAAFACAAITGLTEAVLDDFKSRAAANARNVYPRNVLSGEKVFPHESIYRGSLLANLDGRVLERLSSGPDLRILLARPPRWLGARSGLAAGIAAYVLDRRELRVHARWGARFGFSPELVSARACREPAELAQLILHSSCMPPLVPLYRRGPRIVLDGGLLDNAPADHAGPARSMLVLLTRHYGEQKVPSVDGRTYVQPSREIPIQKWDYTSPELIQQTYELGRSDGERFLMERAFDLDSGRIARA